MKRLQVAALFSLALALPAVAQQDAQGNTCVYIAGSSVCPMFPTYIGTTLLSTNYPFMAEVTDVASFDRLAEEYFTSGAWQTTKIQKELVCTKADNGSIQWQRTAMCGIWTFNAASTACVSVQNGQQAVASIPQICGSTCLQFNDAEREFTKDSQYCSASDNTGVRASTLKTDLSVCYDVSASSETKCVTGEQNESGTCGFGPDLAAACAYCASSSSASCCSSVNCASTTNSSSGTTSQTSGTTTGGGKDSSSSGGKSKGISGGAIAGIVIGVIAGLAIIGAIIFFLMRRRRSQANESHLLHTPSEKLNRTTTPLSVPDHDDVFASHKSSPDVTSTGLSPGVPVGLSPGVPAGTRTSTGTGTTAGIAGVGAGLAGAGAGAALASKATRSHPSASNTAPVSAATTSTGAPVAAAAAALASAAPGQITPGSTVTAIHPYNAALDDEITLEPGMKVHVREIFDDGWATGTVSSGGPVTQLGKLGKFPVVCVGP